MNNDASVIFLIITFLILNIVLMNLLIAMMATTYEETSNRAKSKRLEETYNIIVEHTRVAVAAPVPFNVILIVVEFILFLTQHKLAQKKWPDCKFGRMIDLFLSRNTPIGSTPQQEDSVAQKVGLNISACMERARSRVLKEEQDSKEREALLDKIKDDVTLVKEEMGLAREKISAPSTNETSPETLARVPSTSVNAANKPAINNRPMQSATTNDDLMQRMNEQLKRISNDVVHVTSALTTQNRSASPPHGHQEVETVDRSTSQQQMKTIQVLQDQLVFTRNQLQMAQQENSVQRQEIRKLIDQQEEFMNQLRSARHGGAAPQSPMVWNTREQQLRDARNYMTRGNEFGNA